jgi:uncharacterized protein (TIGR00297 family)
VQERVPFWSRIAWTAFSIVLVGLLAALVRETELRRLVPAGVVTLSFAVVAWQIRGVTLDGAVAGFLVTAILFVAGGPAMFGAVLLVFVLTYAATKLGRKRKQSLAIAERPVGRDAAQIFANVGFAALMAGSAQLTSWHAPLIAAAVAALAEAACDTVSSETGKALSQTARLITSWQRVPAGTDGGISLPGTVLGAFAAGLVGLEAALTGIVSARFAVVAVAAAIVGMFADSMLGATLERRGWLTNNAVNLVSTASAALVVVLTAAMIQP